MMRSVSLNDLTAGHERPLVHLGALPSPILKRRATLSHRGGKCVCWDEALERIVEYHISEDSDACEAGARSSGAAATEGRLSAFYEERQRRLAV